MTCKLLRRHVADLAFLRRIRLRASADRFLVALLYHRNRCWVDNTRPPTLFAGSLPPKFMVARVTAELTGSYELVASRGGLLVLRQEQYPAKQCVLHPAAGRRHALPSKTISSHLHVVMLEESD
ncbi:hypothetical protein ACP70R_027285 [Stipagrostis hirtigluma subsp. patula]